MSLKKKLAIASLIFLVVTIFTLYASRDWLQQKFFQPTTSSVENGVTKSGQREKDIEIVANNLTVPWEIAFLPNDDLLVTERNGVLRRVSDTNKTYEISGIRHIGEGGLLGMTLHPDFDENNWIYLYSTTENNNGLINRVERYTLKDDQLGNKTTIISNIPGASYHDGGRLAFGPDKFLYITTGDAGNEALAQDTSSLAGKILRVSGTGEIPDGNPFNNAVYSYGHRNVQGISWDDAGRLWATEHGRSGVKSGFDELNLIKSGANYGWPAIEGDQARDGMENPIVHSGASDTWAPAGMTFANNSLFFTGLRGSALYEAKLNDGKVETLRAHFREDYGRLRAVVTKGDSLYISTSNTDGRGELRADDDKIIRLDKELFNAVR